MCDPGRSYERDLESIVTLTLFEILEQSQRDTEFRLIGNFESSKDFQQGIISVKTVMQSKTNNPPTFR